MFDKGTIGGVAASWAASLLTQVRAKTDTIPLVQESYRAIEALEAELGESLGAKRVGSLQIAGAEKTAVSIKILADIATQFGITNHWADLQEVKAMDSWSNVRPPERIRKMVVEWLMGIGKPAKRFYLGGKSGFFPYVDPFAERPVSAGV